jgi:hypothetical protein
MAAHLTRSLQDPQYRRDRAEEARTNAERMKDPDAKHMMLRIAEGHERQAKLLQRALDRDTKGSPDR